MCVYVCCTQFLTADKDRAALLTSVTPPDDVLNTECVGKCTTSLTHTTAVNTTHEAIFLSAGRAKQYRIPSQSGTKKWLCTALWDWTQPLTHGRTLVETRITLK